MTRAKLSTAVLAFAVATFGIVGQAHAGEYECASDACSARIVAGGQQFEFSFQWGDVVDTAAGWIINRNDGWVAR